MSNIPEGHRTGPYVVLENLGDKLICLYGTYSYMNARDHKYLIADSKTYNLDKDTCFYISNPKYVSYNSVCEIVDELTPEAKYIYKLNPFEYYFKFNIIKKCDNVFVKDLYERVKILKKTRN